MKNLVILGGGYGGMKILTSIIPNLPYNVLVTLIDRTPYHFLKTEYYALAAGTVSDKHIRIPFPKHPQVNFVNNEVVKLDLDKHKIFLKNKGCMYYDDLIIGLGCEDHYHHIHGADTYTHSIQSLEKSQKTYCHINELQSGSRVAIIGAGLSGVELASELQESRSDLLITLFDKGNTILPSYPIRISNYIEKWFESHKVEIIRNSNITSIEKNIVYNHEEAIFFDCIVWTAGVKPNKVVQELPVKKDKKGRILLTKYHHLPENDHIFVVGDCASLNKPPSAQLSEGQAEQIAAVLTARWKDKKLPYYLPEIRIKGVLGSLGKKHGFGLIANKPLTGRVPRLIKSGVLWKDKTKKRQSLK
ncbi:NAD(P)/FAD-dependent oxidoreductase [Niallia sp. 01092]|uniref:NAD(P)/FAD-dependent oxidoreductase n=1 Tax=unclassified Niallia TaxID=2837522 RepID=UPI003FCF7D8B